MMTRNFSRAEFACKCGCGLADPHPALVVAVQAIRDDLSLPVTISSGCRCAEHNARPPSAVNDRGVRGAGGAANSFHMPKADFDGYCCAADLQAPVPLARLLAAAESLDELERGGIAAYVRGDTAWLHVDVRGVTGKLQPWEGGNIDGVPHRIEAVLAVEAGRREARGKETEIGRAHV